MVDQVSLTAIGGLSASHNKKLMNFLACGPHRPVVSRMNGTRLMCGYLSNLLFSALLATCPGFVLVAETRDGLQEKGATTETSKYALWMVDQVSLTAIGGLSASRNKKLTNFLPCWPGRPVVSRMNGTRLMCGYLSNLLFSALLATCPGFVLAAETRDGLQEKGATMETSKYVIEP